jgi:hypothetical protein
MAEATFTGDPSTLHMGPASITYNGVNLGYTLNDSVAINVNMTSTPILPDQVSLPVKDIITNLEVTVTMTLGEVSAASLALIPGVAAGAGTDPVGIDLLSVAKELIVTPLKAGNGIAWTFPKAAPLMDGPVPFQRTTPQGLQLVFRVYVDTTTKQYMTFAETTAP